MFDFLSQFEWFGRYLEYVGQMSDREIYILIVLSALSLALAFYRWLGVGGLAAIVFVYLIIFTVIKVDLYGTYLERKYEEERHQKVLQREMSKDRIEAGGSIGGDKE